jgi:hypothetical protein
MLSLVPLTVSAWKSWRVHKYACMFLDTRSRDGCRTTGRQQTRCTRAVGVVVNRLSFDNIMALLCYNYVSS